MAKKYRKPGEEGKTTYGCIFFKLKHPPGLTDEQITQGVQMTMQTLRFDIEHDEGELITPAEFYTKASEYQGNPDIAIGSQSIVDASEGKALQ